MTSFSLRRLRLRPGEESRDEHEVELEPSSSAASATCPSPSRFRRSSSSPAPPPARSSSCASTTRLHGPCYRCLGRRRRSTSPIAAREYQAYEPGRRGAADPVPRDDQLDLSGWARDARRARAARQDPLPPRLRRPLPGLRPDLNDEPHEHDEEQASTRAGPPSRRSATNLSYDWFSALQWPSPRGRPRSPAATSGGPRIRSRRRASTTCPQCGSPKLRAPRLPDLQDVQGPRSRAAPLPRRRRPT